MWLTDGMDKRHAAMVETATVRYVHQLTVRRALGAPASIGRSVSVFTCTATNPLQQYGEGPHDGGFRSVCRPTRRQPAPAQLLTVSVPVQCLVGLGLGVHLAATRCSVEVVRKTAVPVRPAGRHGVTLRQHNCLHLLVPYHDPTPAAHGKTLDGGQRTL